MQSYDNKMSTKVLLEVYSIVAAVSLLLLQVSAAPHSSNKQERIVNGTIVPQGKYPGMVSLQMDGHHLCGGTILDKNYVLTAAHCVYGQLPTVLAGTVDLTQGGSRHKVVHIILHERYSLSQFINDIALLQVDPPFEMGVGDIGPVTLPTQGQDSPGGSPGTVIGWGIPYSGGSEVNDLYEVDLVVVGDEECNEIHNRSPAASLLDRPYPSNICAGVPEGGKGQCSGDSGGPLFVNGYQAGIVSWSVKPCTIAPYPGVYTEVSHFIDWINSKIN